MKLFEYIDKTEFNLMVEKGYIKVVEHPSGNGYKVINYTKSCTYDWVWNDTTTKCRGIIVDGDYNIISRPFPKFYNYEEIEDKSIIPTDEHFTVWEKLDGTLGILYWIGDTPYIATKSSFDNEQALHATRILHTKYRNSWHILDKNITYLFEIIYPADMKCVRYGGIDDIFLIAAIPTHKLEHEYHIHLYGNHFNIVKSYDGVKDWTLLREVFSGDNREGFVIKFSSGFRIKLKYEEYKRLHSIKTGFTEKMVFKLLRDGDYDSINEAMELFDEEQKPFYQSLIDKVESYYNEIKTISLNEYRDDFETDKDAALYIKTCTYPHVLFYMRKGYDYNALIWKYVERKIKE